MPYVEMMMTVKALSKLFIKGLPIHKNFVSK